MNNGYRCLRCGHLDRLHRQLRNELAVTTTCARCGSYDIEPCQVTNEMLTVPLRVLQTAEEAALYWKRKAEELSHVVNQAIINGMLPAPYAGEARRIMAGRA